MFTLNLRQTDGAGQSKLGPKQLHGPGRSQPEAQTSPSVAAFVVFLRQGGCWGREELWQERCRAGGRQPQKYAHLALNHSPLAGVPKLFRTRVAADSAPFPLPCIQPALNKCSLGDWELGSSPTGGLSRGGPGFANGQLPATRGPAHPPWRGLAPRDLGWKPETTLGGRREAGTGRSAQAQAPPLAVAAGAHQSASGSTSGAP